MVDEQLKITDLQVFFDPNPLIARLMTPHSKQAAAVESIQQQHMGCPMAAAVSTAMKTLEIVEQANNEEEEKVAEIPDAAASSSCVMQ